MPIGLTITPLLPSSTLGSTLVGAPTVSPAAARETRKQLRPRTVLEPPHTCCRRAWEHWLALPQPLCSCRAAGAQVTRMCTATIPLLHNLSSAVEESPVHYDQSPPSSTSPYVHLLPATAATARPQTRESLWTGRRPVPLRPSTFGSPIDPIDPIGVGCAAGLGCATSGVSRVRGQKPGAGGAVRG
eukprot:scaffold603_cov404-Prasinococcus_capsulatus_cf.AAC.37